MGILEAVRISIFSPISTNPLYIISIYRHPGHFDSQLWLRFVNSLPSSSCILITGDFNAHHPYWGCRSADAVGLSLLEVTQESFLFSINDGKATFISRPHLTPSVIDVSFVFSDLCLYCTWNVLDDSLGSDHIPTITHLNLPIEIRSHFSHKLKTSRINWKLFKSNLYSHTIS